MPALHPVLQELVQRYPDLTPCLPAIEKAFTLLHATFQQGGKLLICGNGGSAADAQHWVAELMKSFESPRPISAEFQQRLVAIAPHHAQPIVAQLQGALPAMALSGQIAFDSAFSNDVSATMGFAQQVFGLGVAGDTLVGMSTSGDSENVLNALRVAKAKGLHTLGLTGQSGGTMASASPPLCDGLICVPYTRTRDIQERHLPIYHALSLMLEQAFFA